MKFSVQTGFAQFHAELGRCSMFTANPVVPGFDLGVFRERQSSDKQKTGESTSFVLARIKGICWWALAVIHLFSPTFHSLISILLPQQCSAAF